MSKQDQERERHVFSYINLTYAQFLGFAEVATKDTYFLSFRAVLTQSLWMIFTDMKYKKFCINHLFFPRQKVKTFMRFSVRLNSPPQISAFAYECREDAFSSFC